MPDGAQVASPEATSGARPDDAVGWVRFIGNATLLIRYGPLTVLTDPNFVGRDAEVPLGFGLTATRLTDPAMEADEVPRPDLVVVSHHHGDHFDAVAADWLPSSVPIVTCPGGAGHLEEQGFTAVRPLRTWETIEHERDGVRLRLTAVPAQHAPGPLSFALPEVTGTVLDFWNDRGEPARHGGKRKGRRAGASDERERSPDLRLYVSGDTIFNDHLAEIRDRCPGIDIAFIHLGGMRLMGMQVTLDASHGVELINLLQPRLAIPIHYNDYDTSTSSLAEFVAAVNEAGLADRVRYLRHGDAWPLPVKAPRGGASV